MNQPHYEPVMPKGYTPDSLMQTLRSQGIRDPRVLKALAKLPREEFVLPEFTDFAYKDTALPIHCGQTISQPFITALMTEKLMIGARDRVLEIGTGSGYQTAVLAQLAKEVYTVEQYEALALEAEQRFARHKLKNIFQFTGDGALGLEEYAPFERIIVTAAASEVPPALLEQLKTGGRMIIPLGGEEVQRLTVIDKDRNGLDKQELMAVRFVPLTDISG